MKNFFLTHKVLCIIVAVALIATGTTVAINNLNFDKTDIVSTTTSGTSNLQNSETNTTTSQPAEQKHTGKITTETSDNVLMCFVGSDKALQNWAHTSSKIEFERSYPDTFIFTETPYLIAADGKYALDLSAKGDKSVIGYLTKEGSEIIAHIAGKDGVVMANPDSAHLFGWLIDGSAVKEINFNGNFNTSNMVSAYHMFKNSYNLESLDVSCFDTSNLVNASYMFGSCKSLRNIDLSNFNTSNIKFMSGMFYYCSSLTSLNVTNFDTSNVTTMSCLFSGCDSLTSIDVSNFNTTNVADMTFMFSNCPKLTNLYLSNFDTSSVTDVHNMFENDLNLTTIDLPSFNASNNINYDNLFLGCDSLREIKYADKTYTRELFESYMDSNLNTN